MRTSIPSWLRAWAIAVFGCILWTLLTLPRFYADGSLYAKQVMNYDLGRSGGSLPEMWDFGHVLWRFSGYGLFHLGRPVWALFEDPATYLAYFLPLLVMSWIGTAVALYATLRLIERFDSSLTTALIVAVVYLSINAVLNYLQAGSSYSVGLAFLTLAILEIHVAPGRPVGSARPLIAGILLALSAGFWFPYVVVFPAILLTPVLLPADGPDGRAEGWKTALRCGIYTSLFTIAVYLVPIIQMRLFSIPQMLEWMRSASHGWSQNKRYIRFVFGFPASFFYQASEGILFKRYLLHDPYAPVTLAELFRASLAKMGLFFGFLGLLLLAMFRRPERNILWWMAFALVSDVVFAIFIFEPSSIERYLCLLPFLFVAVVACRGTKMKWATLVFASLLVVNNVSAHWRPSGLEDYDRAQARAQAVYSRLTPNDLVFVVTQDDEINSLSTGYVFHPLNRNVSLHTTPMVSIAIRNIVVWRENFGRLTKSVWARNGNVWLSKRLFAERPKPEWRWAEGDDAHIRWTDIPSFFKQFDLTDTVGGDDGFVLFPKTEKNAALIDSLAANWRKVD